MSECVSPNLKEICIPLIQEKAASIEREIKKREKKGEKAMVVASENGGAGEHPNMLLTLHLELNRHEEVINILNNTPECKVENPPTAVFEEEEEYEEE